MLSRRIVATTSRSLSRARRFRASSWTQAGDDSSVSGVSWESVSGVGVKSWVLYSSLIRVPPWDGCTFLLPSYCHKPQYHTAHTSQLFPLRLLPRRRGRQAGQQRTRLGHVKLRLGPPAAHVLVVLHGWQPVDGMNEVSQRSPRLLQPPL